MIRRPPRSTPLYSSAASDVYKRQIQRTLPFNFGVEWRALGNLTFAVSWLHGSSFGLRFSGALDTKTLPKRKKGRTFYSSIEPRSLSGAPDSLDLEAWYDRLLYDAERSGLRINKARLHDRNAAVDIEVENARFALTADACLLYTSPSPRDATLSRMPSSA